MATDYFVAFYIRYVLAITLALAIVGLYLSRRSGPTEPGRVHWKHIARGYFGVVFASLAYACAITIAIGFEKVGLEHIGASQLPKWIPSWTLYMFVLITPIVLFMVTVLGIPILLLLRRFGFASLTGAIAIAFLYAGLYSGHVYRKPINFWCESHIQECVQEKFVSSLIPAILVALGFAGAAPLPLLVSRRNTVKVVQGH